LFDKTKVRPLLPPEQGSFLFVYLFYFNMEKRFALLSEWAMPTTTLAAITPFEVVFFGKNEIAAFHVIVFTFHQWIVG
jgi:hypothetical protein